MDEARQLSDSELRMKLISYGVNVGPITASTRGILEKKLAKFLDGSATPSANESSDEETSTKPKTNRRSSTGRRSSKKIALAPYSSDEEDLNSIRSSNDNKISSANNLKNSKSEFVDPNDVLIPPQLKNSPMTTIRSRPQSRRSSSFNVLAQSTANTSTELKPVTLKVRDNEFSDDEVSTSRKTLSSGVTPCTTDSVTSSPSNHHSLTNGSLERQINNHSNGDNRVDADDDTSDSTPSTSHISNSVKREEPLIPVSPTNKLDIPDDVQDELNSSLKQVRKSFLSKRPSPNNHKFTYYHRSNRSHHQTENDEADTDSTHYAGDDDEEEIDVEFTEKRMSGYISNIKGLSWPIVILFAVVSALIGVYFYNAHTNGIPTIAGETESKQHKHFRLVNCLYQKLSILAGDAECGEAESRWLHNSSLPNFVKPCLVMGDKIDDILSNLTNYQDFFVFNEHGDVSSKFVYRSLGCRINQAVSVVMLRVIVIAVIIALCIGFYFAMKKRWSNREENTRQMLILSEKIIETLKRHSEACLDDKSLPSYIPIVHVRDSLITIDKRNSMMTPWYHAVAFVNSDSRVRMETQRISGEDFDCWRWIAAVGTPKLKKETKVATETHLSNEQDKCWQGPAFDAIEKVVRVPIVTPTPCLKIRYMHEGSEEKGVAWEKRVENAILEKCSEVGAEILHLYVDKSSKEGCVYVKCSSLESAGKAFRNMYGNWFDSRLVIVKFVTLARYHQRFPDALNRSEPLKQDQDIPTSMNWVSE